MGRSDERGLVTLDTGQDIIVAPPSRADPALVNNRECRRTAAKDRAVIEARVEAEREARKAQ